jgi:hypothetical protein
MSKNMDIDIPYVKLVLKLNELFKEETYDYSFYDFDRIEIKKIDSMYIKLEEIKKNTNALKTFCDEINTKLIDFEVTNIGNILCGKTYKKSKDNIPIQMQTGYYYSFTVICKRKLLNKLLT